MDQNEDNNYKAVESKTIDGSMQHSDNQNRYAASSKKGYDKTSGIGATKINYAGKNIKQISKRGTLPGYMKKNITSSRPNAVEGNIDSERKSHIDNKENSVENKTDDTSKDNKNFKKRGSILGKKIKKLFSGKSKGSNPENETLNIINKRRIIAILFSIVGSLLTFLPILFVPIILVLGISGISILDGGSSNAIYSETEHYDSVSEKIEYWWPVGSEETEEKNGKTFATGDPVASTISSSFSSSPDESEYHSGIDIRATNETEYGNVNVIAAKSGTVTTVNNDANCKSNETVEECNGTGYGNHVIIEHGDGTSTLYGHLHENTITVAAGDTVEQGQVIGKMGSSGKTSEMVLYFEVIENGSAVNPENYISDKNPRPLPKGNYVEGNNNKQTVCLTLKNNELSDTATAALMTNINSESSFNPNALGDNGTSFGLCQWHNERWDNLKNKFPNSHEEISSQIEFLINELQTSYPSVYDYLNKYKYDAGEKTYYFCNNFERPADTQNTCNGRKENVNEFVEFVNNGCS